VGGEVVGTGGGNSGLINGDHGAVGEGLEAVESRGVSCTIDSGSSIGVHSANNTLGGQVVGTGGGNSGLVSGDHGAVGVGNQLGVEVQGAVVAIAVGNRGGGHSGGSSIGHRGSGVAGHRAGGVGNRGGSSVSVALGGQMVGTGGGNSGLVNRDHSAVGVGDQLEVEVEGTSVAIGRGIARVSSNWGSSHSRGSSVGNGGGSHSRGSGVGNRGSSVAGNSSLGGEVVGTGGGNSGLIDGDHGAVGEGLEAVESVGVAVASVVAVASAVHSGSGNNTLGGEVVGTGGLHGGLVNGDHGAVGEGLESEESLRGGSSNTGGENQKLHV